MGTEVNSRRGRRRRAWDDRAPTVRQIYALAAALCAFTEQEFPRTRADASDLIERVRVDIGHPEPALATRDRDETPLQRRLRHRRDRRAARDPE